MNKIHSFLYLNPITRIKLILKSDLKKLIYKRLKRRKRSNFERDIDVIKS